MKRDETDRRTKRPGPKVKVQPSAEHAALALREAAVVMAPLARWLLRSGVSYPAFAEMLKPVFLDAARAELEQSDTAATQSALSMLSGVHRKDVRTFEASPAPLHPALRPSLPSQVFTKWLSDARYRGADGQPRALPRSGTGRTFETLCRTLSSDVHPRTVLDELVRLGLVSVDDARVSVLATSFLPAAQLDEVTALVSANVADHIAAAVSNLTTNAPRSLEQSVFADGLTAESVAVLHHTARELWKTAFETIVTQAQQRVELDDEPVDGMRMRFGVYFFSEPAAAPAPERAAPRNKSQAKPAKARPRSKP
jgi:hypothetical protein